MPIQQEGYSFKGVPSYDHVVWIRSTFIRSNLISPNNLRLYLVVAGLKGLDQIYISQETMAQRMGGCSVRTVQRILDELCGLGLLESLGRRTTRGRFTSNEYQLVKLDDWLKKNDQYNRSNTCLYKPFVYSTAISDSELRLFAVIKSFEGFDHIELSIPQLCTYTGLSKPSLLAARTSLKEKGLIQYERRGNAVVGNSANEYFWFDEDAWVETEDVETKEE